MSSRGSTDLQLGLAIRRSHHQPRHRNRMRILGAVRVVMLSPLVVLSTLLVTMAVSPQSASSDPSANIAEQQVLVAPEEACSDFNRGREYSGSPWTLNDCTQVWSQFVDTVPSDLDRRPWGIDLWRRAAVRLRMDGSPCLVASTPSPGGAGSYMIQQLGAWIFAEQMGCDLVSPDWRSRQLAPGEDSAALYCHTVATTRETQQALLRRKANDIRHCTMINWPEYFKLDIPSVELPERRTFRVIEVSLEHGGDFQMGLREHIEYAGVSALGLDRILFTIDATSASQHLLAIGSWDETKRQTVREVLEEARTNFHWHPRRWYGEKGSCGFDLQRLNFAVHVRTGDRRDFQDVDEDYFDRLELFMIAVTEAVSTKGLLPPVFHVFSETLSPCPSEQTQIFDEFPTWPVEADQISRCLEAETPEDCPEKRAGARLCNADRPGVFFVHNKPIVLHVGRNVGEAMSCMIQSDGVMMGCSTFGQVAGLLTKGIRFFSTQCDGENTPEKHKAMPPLAIAERGHLWVPISGSWRDPMLVSTEILSGALEMLLRNMHNA